MTLAAIVLLPLASAAFFYWRNDEDPRQIVAGKDEFVASYFIGILAPLGIVAHILWEARLLLGTLLVAFCLYANLLHWGLL